MLAKIINKKEVVVSTLAVDFELIDEEQDFIAGQYLTLTLNKLNYPDPRGSQRFFSIVNSPSQKKILTIATRLSDSGFKRTLKELPLGAEVKISNIGGSFILPPDLAKPVVMIAGGIGITPFMSMLQFATEQKLPYKITLVYSNRNQQSTAFKNELENLAEQNPNLKLIFTMTQDSGWSGEKRRIDQNFIKDYFPEPNLNFYMTAGPPVMVEAVYNALKKAGVDKSNIKTEEFSGYI